MKKLVTVLAVLSVFAAFQPAHAAKKPKAIKTTFYLHGTETVGEIEMINNFGTGYFKMDGTEPTESAPKSATGLFWAGDPQMWNDCAGMAALPVWTGAMAGRIKGDMKLLLHTITPGPRQIEIEIWPDVVSQTCASNDLSEGTYPEPAATATVDLAPGHAETEVVFEDVDIKAVGSLMVQITSIGPAATRILYDATDYASFLEFSCIPDKAKSCV